MITGRFWRRDTLTQAGMMIRWQILTLVFLQATLGMGQERAQTPVLAVMQAPATSTNPGAGKSVDEELEKATFRAVEKLLPQVALIETSGGQDMMLPTAVRKVVGPTTGLVVDANGYIITSSFNFTNKPTDIFVTVPGKGRAVAKVVGADLSRMLTLLKVDMKNLSVPEAFPKSQLQVGQSCLALGRTLEANMTRPPTVALGIISAVNRIWGKAVQTDAKVSPVNYGGPLVALDGRVIGVLVPASPEGAETDHAGTEWYDSGIGFAIPLEDIRRVLPKLMAGTAEKPVNLRGGVFGIPAPQPAQYLDPAVLTSILPKSAAEEAGLKKGDRVLSIDGKPINTMAQFLHGFKALYEGDSIALKISRDGKDVDIPKLTLRGVQTDFTPGFVGILPMRDDPEPGVEIRYVFPGSPAATATLKPGDRIMKISQPGGSQLIPFSGRDQLAQLVWKSAELPGKPRISR
jgi:serine protease Do